MAIFKRFVESIGDTLRGNSSAPPEPFLDRPIEIYGGHVPWEMPVQLALSDFLKPCDCALDVGANIGGLSIAMSRLVGTTGEIHSFEANPQIVPWLEKQLEANHAANVKLVPKAVFKTSGLTMPFYCDDSHYGVASGFRRRGKRWPKAVVETVSLDDYCSEHALKPAAIKIDVEGAEIDVLHGAERLIDRERPVIVFEYCAKLPLARDSVNFVRGKDYAVFDINLYESVTREFYRSKYRELPLVNVVAIPSERLATSGYQGLTKNLLAEAPNESVKCELEAGRYVVQIDLEGDPEGRASLQVLDETDEKLAYFEAKVRALQSPANSNIVFEVTGPTQIHLRVVTKAGEPPNVQRSAVFQILKG